MWFHQYPQRWEDEQSSLKQYNIDFEVDEELKTLGYLRLFLLVTKESTLTGIPEKFLPLKLTVAYPKYFPFFRPTVFAEEIELARHQNTLNKNLCLLPRPTSNWLPETTIGSILNEQLSKVLTLGEVTDSETLQQNHDEQAEPVSAYYVTMLHAPVIIDTSQFDSTEAINDEIKLIGYLRLGVKSDETTPSRMFATETFDENRNSLGKHDFGLKLQNLGGLAAVYRTKVPPPFKDPAKSYDWFLGLAGQNRHQFRNPQVAKNGKAVTDVVGITFPEEHLPGVVSWGWLFLVKITNSFKPAKGKVKIEHFVHFTQANRFSLSELRFRIPNLDSLAKKKIVVFGLGALGAPSVLEFAKNGIGEISLVDFDTVNAGTIVRWPLGISTAGMFKTEALENHIKENYPYVSVKKYIYMVGAEDIGTLDISEDALSKFLSLEEILSEASLIYDATAEGGVSDFLCARAKERNIPFICVYGTPGIWGGVVMRYIPYVTGCRMCFQYALQDGTIPKPPADDKGSIQAVGCGDISFTGTSFELGNIVNSGVRTAIGVLCDESGGYPNISGDVGILSLVDKNGNPTFPIWSAHQLNRHPSCPYCN